VTPPGPPGAPGHLLEVRQIDGKLVRHASAAQADALVRNGVAWPVVSPSGRVRYVQLKPSKGAVGRTVAQDSVTTTGKARWAREHHRQRSEAYRGGQDEGAKHR